MEQHISEADSARKVAHLRAVSHPVAGKWLTVIPSPSLGTTLEPNSFRVCAGLRLGAHFLHPHMCSRCGVAVTPDGTHPLACLKSAGRQARHAEMIDIVTRALQAANIPTLKEPNNLSRSDGRRPDGVTII